MRFRRGRMSLLLFATMVLAVFWGIKATNAGVYLSSPHGNATIGVNRDAGYAIGHCAQCHDPHSGTTGGYNLIYAGTAMCFNNGGGSCHNAQPTTYPCGEAARLPGSDTANGQYFERNTSGTKTTGVDNRCRWPGSSVWGNTGSTSIWSNTRYISPHYMDTDMPKLDGSSRGLCTNCHNPHGVASPQLDMLLNVYNTPGPTSNYSVCFSVTTSDGTTYTCHDTGGEPSITGNTLIKGFYDQADTRAGHQIRCSTKNVTGTCPPSGSGITVGDKMPCYNCHDPHGSEGANGANPNYFLISDQSERAWSNFNPETAARVRELCFGCHIASNGSASSKTVMSITMNVLPTVSGAHASTDTASCYGCHGSSYTAATDENVHHPGPGGECKTCHATAQGSGGYRRQVTSGGSSGGDIGNDTGKTSYHINATYANLSSSDCEDCHVQDQHMSVSDPGVRVWNNDTGATIAYTGTATQLNTHCTTCHDSNGATRSGGGGTTPFSASGDSTTVPNVNSEWVKTYNHNNASSGCMGCHGNYGNSGNTYNPKINAHGSTTTDILNNSPQYTLCFTCHGASGPAAQNIQNQFNTASYTGGIHPVLGSSVTPKSTIMQADTSGDLFVDGWTKNSTMTCSDCHSSNNLSGPKGPHGSAYRYINKGIDTGITTGARGPTSTRAYGSPKNSDCASAYCYENLCVNCHASDVYTLGYSGTTNASESSRSGLRHYSDMNSSCFGTHSETAEGTRENIGCTNCHGGDSHIAGSPTGQGSGPSPQYTVDKGNIHGGLWVAGTGGSGTGFCDGNSWYRAPDSTDCYAPGKASKGWDQTWTTCVHGDHAGI